MQDFFVMWLVVLLFGWGNLATGILIGRQLILSLECPDGYRVEIVDKEAVCTPY